MIELTGTAAMLFGVTAAVIVAGFFAVWLVVLARSTNGQPVLAYEARRPVPWSLLDLVLLLIAHILLMAIASEIVVGVVGDGLAKDPSTEQLIALLVATMIANAATLLGGIALLRFKAGASWRDLGLAREKLVADVALGIAAFFALAVPVYVIQVALNYVTQIEYDHALIDAIEQDSSAGNFVICAVIAVVAAPLAEEFLFRLVLQGWMERAETFLRRGLRNVRTDAGDIVLEADPTGDDPPLGAAETEAEAGNPYASPAIITPGTHDNIGEAETYDPPTRVPRGLVPILISSLLFALAHLGQGAAPIPLFVLALGLGFLYHRTHRLLPCILVHMLLNGTSIFVMALSLMK